MITGTHIATQCTLKAGSKSTDQVLAFSDSLSGKGAELAGMVKIDFGTMDQWFEEETPIYVHPKDPFKRVDILQSVREIRVSVDGHVLAQTLSSMHLYETGLPVCVSLSQTARLGMAIVERRSCYTTFTLRELRSRTHPSVYRSATTSP